MQLSSTLRRFAGVAVIALALAACNGDDPDTGGTGTETGTASPTATPPPEIDVVGRGDGQLTIASVIAESGFLDYLGGPVIAGINLAIDEINDNGGVFDQDVTLLEYDSGTDPAVAGPNVNDALAQGADVIVGAMASGVSQSFIDVLNANEVYQCSPSNTSPAFPTQANAQHYFRTSPEDLPQAELFGNAIVDAGHGGNVAIIARSDDYGVNLADLIANDLSNLGATLAFDEPIIYQDDTTFESETDQIVGADPSAVVIIGFREAAALLNSLVAAGLDPATFYGSDGVMSSRLPELVGGDPGVIDGMTVFGASGTAEFNQRLADAGVNDFLYGAQGYDCVMLFALWAVSEGSDDTGQWDPQTLRDLTSGGEECNSFADCVALIEDGQDILFNGGSGGILALQEGNPGGIGSIGEPSAVVYAIAQFQDGGTLVTLRTEDVTLS